MKHKQVTVEFLKDYTYHANGVKDTTIKKGEKRVIPLFAAEARERTGDVKILKDED